MILHNDIHDRIHCKWYICDFDKINFTYSQLFCIDTSEVKPETEELVPVPDQQNE